MDRFDFIRTKGFEISLVVPLVGYIVLLTIVPVFYAVYLSIIDSSSNTFILQHYREIIFHFQFKQALFNTLFITFYWPFSGAVPRDDHGIDPESEFQGAWCP